MMSTNDLSLFNRPCPVCEKKNDHSIYQNELATLDGLDMSYQVAECEDCGFVYANVLPNAEQYDSYYRGLSKYDLVGEVNNLPEVDLFRAKSAVDFCRPYIKQDAAIADLGCGSGILLNAFDLEGWADVYGLDPAPNAHDKANKMFALTHVYTGTLDQAAEELPLAKMDLICLMGVLEHLPMLRENLEKLVQSLSSTAKIMIEVPALERFIRDEFEPYGEFSLEHIQFFSAQTLIQLMANLGYLPLDISYLDLPKGSTDSLLCLFSQQVEKKTVVLEQKGIKDYLYQSSIMMVSVMQTILSCKGQQFIIYGAGSHTARLLPQLREAGWAKKLICLVDGNTNLHGKVMDGLKIEPPEIVNEYPQATVIISSFRAEKSIEKMLKGKYPNLLVTLY